MPYSELVGHEKQIETLKRALARNRMHHAYIFLGPEGVGKKTVALSLAMAIHCLERQDDFCGTCPNCVRIRNSNHPDVRLIRPEPGKKDISIQQIRDLERELNLRPFCGKKKIALLDPASLMNIAAQSALLKTLEEPPRDSLVILITTSTGELLPTLISRCLRLSFSSLPSSLVMKFLVEQKGIGPKDAEVLAAVSQGCPGKAISSAIEDFAEKRQAWIQKVSSLQAGDFKTVIELADDVSDDRDESLLFLEWMEGWLRDVLLHRVTESLQGICNFDKADEIRKFAERYSLDGILFLRSKALKTATAIRQNVNRRIALENLLCQVVRVQ
ncbi:MAG: DNA polymerase III subunit delta' [Deltaproteobacteria bacterium]|nr:DNA polymerase III subunit delta' [Deltaproteobacteria bacterium]